MRPCLKKKEKKAGEKRNNLQKKREKKKKRTLVSVQEISFKILYDNNDYLPGVPMHISFSDIDFVFYFKASEKQTKKISRLRKFLSDRVRTPQDCNIGLHGKYPTNRAG